MNARFIRDIELDMEVGDQFAGRAGYALFALRRQVAVVVNEVVVEDVGTRGLAVGEVPDCLRHTARPEVPGR